MSWKPVIVGVDATPAAAGAAAFGCHLAAVTQTRCHLVHATRDAWTLYAAVEAPQAVRGYARQFINGGTTRDFVAFARRTASPDLSAFFADWMFTTRWTGLLATATSIRDLADHYRSK